MKHLVLFISALLLLHNAGECFREVQNFTLTGRDVYAHSKYLYSLLTSILCKCKSQSRRQKYQVFNKQIKILSFLQLPNLSVNKRIYFTPTL